jgi:hypothetical protein
MPDLLLELRSEEIPARMQRKAAGDLKKMITDGLVEAGLTYEAAREYWTPRRLTLDVRGVTARSRDVVERKGPGTKAPEQAIQGFLRSAGLASIDEAQIQSDPKKGDFYVARDQAGQGGRRDCRRAGARRGAALPVAQGDALGCGLRPEGVRYGKTEGRAARRCAGCGHCSRLCAPLALRRKSRSSSTSKSTASGLAMSPMAIVSTPRTPSPFAASMTMPIEACRRQGRARR